MFAGRPWAGSGVSVCVHRRSPVSALMAVMEPVLPTANTRPTSSPTATPRRAGRSGSANSHTSSPLFAFSATTLQFEVGTRIRPFDIVSPVWFVLPGSCVAQAPPSELTLLEVIVPSVEKRWFDDEPPYTGHSLADAPTARPCRAVFAAVREASTSGHGWAPPPGVPGVAADTAGRLVLSDARASAAVSVRRAGPGAMPLTCRM